MWKQIKEQTSLWSLSLPSSFCSLFLFRETSQLYWLGMRGSKMPAGPWLLGPGWALCKDPHLSPGSTQANSPTSTPATAHCPCCCYWNHGPNSLKTQSFQKKWENKRAENKPSNKNMYTHVHGSNIHHHQKVETTQTSISGQADEQNVACPSNGMSLSHKKE